MLAGAFFTAVASASTPSEDTDYFERNAGKGYFRNMDGSVRVFEGALVREDLSTEGDLWIGRGAVVRGNVSVQGDLIMEPDSRIEGSAVVRGAANFKENSLITGDVSIDGHVYRGNNAPEYMFRSRMRKGLVQESPRSAEALQMIRDGMVGEGVITVVHEANGELSYALLRQFFSRGVPCMVVGREPPERIRGVRGIPIEDENVVWLTSLVGKRCFNPTHLSSILSTMAKFMESNRNCFILIDGMEYLITNNGFEQTLKFVNRLEDMMSSSSARMVLSMDPRALDTQSAVLLEKRAHVVGDYTDDGRRLPSGVEGKIDEYLRKTQVLMNELKASPDLSLLSDVIQKIVDQVSELRDLFQERERKIEQAIQQLKGSATGREAEMEIQIRQNAELLLRAVLLAERLSEEKREKQVR